MDIQLMAERNQHLDITKGALILSVVLGHSLQLLYGGSPGLWTDSAFKAIWLFNMPLFMGIAGYLSHDSIRAKPLLGLLRKRAVNYILPIFVWAALSETAVFFYVHRKDTGALTQLSNYTQLPELIGRNALDILWFLWALFFSIVLTAVLNKVPKFFWACYAAASIGVLFLPDTYHLTLIKFTFHFFQIGFLMKSWGIGGRKAGFAGTETPRTEARSEEREASRQRHGNWWRSGHPRKSLGIFVQKKGVLISSLLVYGLSFWLWTPTSYIYMSSMSPSAANMGGIVLRLAAGISGGILCLQACQWIPQNQLGRYMAKLGKDSIYLYIIHAYLLGFVGRILAHSIPMGELSRATIWCAGIPLALIVAQSSWYAGSLIASRTGLSILLLGKGARG